MKDSITILLIFCFCAPAWAQKQVIIHRVGQPALRVDVAEVDSITFGDATDIPAEPVDLGLSVRWASYNLGATSPSGYGNYYAWGETEPKETYTEENYTANVTMPSIAGTLYDAASVLWGAEWSMPTQEQIKELTTQCQWTWTAQDGVNGYRVRGPSGNSIFLPAAGQHRADAMNVGSTGYYWSATASKDYATAAYNLNFAGYTGEWSANRSYGFTIRAVRK